MAASTCQGKGATTQVHRNANTLIRGLLSEDLAVHKRGDSSRALTKCTAKIKEVVNNLL